VINAAVPTSGPVGTTVTLNFNNLIASRSATVKFGTVSISNSTVTTNSTGGWKGTVSVPSGAGNTVSVSDGTNSLSTSFTVTTPVINAAVPTSGPVGTTVTLNFNNLIAGASYTIKFGTTTASGAQATGTTNSTGGFAGTVTVPSGISSGSQPLTATDTINSINTPFTVTTPTVHVLPSSGSVGTTVVLSGSNFIPSSPITVKYDGTTVTTSPASVTSNSTG
ncbi:MAG: hypothetical protein KGI33_12860, partial [Thaumarchaeota archaeon]|nr:hypothetical protein [Nitrososphaerota archaeon]